MKKSSAFQKTIRFDEFILALKYFMKNKGITHVSGLCNAELLRKNLTEEELSAIFFSALKHKVFVKQGSDVHINFDLYRIMNAFSQSKNVVTVHKPSYENEKMISFAKADDTWIVLLQNAGKNEVSIMADSSLDKLYQIVASELKKKDKNSQFHPKKLNKQLEKMDLAVRFQEAYEYQLVMLALENSTGRQTGEAVLFHVGKESFNVLTGAIEENRIESFPAEALDEKVKECLIAMTRDVGPDNPDGTDKNNRTGTDYKRMNEEEEPYTKFSFQQLSANRSFPHSVPQLLKLQLKNWVKQLTNWKTWVVMLVIQLLFAAAVLIWNMYGMCYLNDTFRISSNAFWGNATAYLFAGTIRRGNDIKGLSVFTKAFDTVLLAGSFYCLLGIAFRSMIGTIVKGKFMNSVDNMLRFPSHMKQYSKKAGKGIVHYIWLGVLIAAPIGFLLWNPFTVALLAVMLFFSCVKADSSNISVPVMLFRSASGYKRVMEGRKKKPLFADVQLRLFGISIGFFIYTFVNILVWGLFDYNFWVRLVFTVLLMILALLGLGIIKVNKPQKVAACLAVLVVCSVLVMLSRNGMMVYADDGGWSESGGTLAGLFANAGFATILGLSALLAVCTLGGSLLAAGIIGGVVGAGSFVWSCATETGRETAADFMLGQYSPYGGDSKIAAGLNFAVGLVPGIGEIWGVASSTRDAVYNFSHGNELSGIFNIVCGGLSLKGLDDGLRLAKDGLVNAAEKTVLKSVVKKEVKKNVDNLISGITGSADNVATAAAGSADNVAAAAAGSADNVAAAAAGSADNAAGAAGAAAQTHKPGVVEKVVSGVITRKTTKRIVNTLLGGQTKQVQQKMVDNIVSGISGNIKQGVAGDVIQKADDWLNGSSTEMPFVQQGTQGNIEVPDSNVGNSMGESTGANNINEFGSTETKVHNTESIPEDGSINTDGINADSEVFSPEETAEVFEAMTDDEIRNLLDTIAEQFGKSGEQMPALCAELKQYVDSVGEGSIDRNVIKYILMKG